MRRALPEIRAAGADLVIVGSGRPEQARDFLEATKLERAGGGVEVFCDEDLTAYRLARMKRGVLRTLGPRAAWNVVRTLARGYLPSGARAQGDPYQQGGLLVVTKAGEIVFHHASDVAGERLPIEEAIAAARGGL